MQWSQRRNQTVSAAISQCLHGDGGQLGNMECCSSAEVKVTPINPSLPALNICKIMPRFICSGATSQYRLLPLQSRHSSLCRINTCVHIIE